MINLIFNVLTDEDWWSKIEIKFIKVGESGKFGIIVTHFLK